MNIAFKPDAGRDRYDGLLYYMHDGPSALCFRLSGDLCRHTASDLEQARQTAWSTIGGKAVWADLTDLANVDAVGCRLLERWQALGTELVVTSTRAQRRVRLRTGLPVTLRLQHGRKSDRPGVHLIGLWLAALLAIWLLAIATSAGISAITGLPSAEVRAKTPHRLAGLIPSQIQLNERPGVMRLHEPLSGGRQ